MGGTIGCIVTCPLEVVKTRLQSSVVNLHIAPATSYTTTPGPGCTASVRSLRASSISNHFFLVRFIRHIVETEGTKALFKGLGPNLVGVAPSRAIYFCTYSFAKRICNEHFPSPDSPPVHICSAAAAGFASSTATNPIWFVKTRLQLDQSRYGTTTAWSCIKSIYREAGLTGFYKGITASYFGISETITHFVIYEFIKSKLRERRLREYGPDSNDSYNFFQFMAAGAVSKTIASIFAYPHGKLYFTNEYHFCNDSLFSEVARTRLRQEGNKYRKFFQTLWLVWKEEGREGLYRGLGTQLVRQIPNTAIMMATYELVVYLLQSPSVEPDPINQKN